MGVENRIQIVSVACSYELRHYQTQARTQPILEYQNDFPANKHCRSTHKYDILIENIQFNQL